MVLLRTSVHSASLSPAMQKKVVHLRDKSSCRSGRSLRRLGIRSKTTQNVLNLHAGGWSPIANVEYKAEVSLTDNK